MAIPFHAEAKTLQMKKVSVIFGTRPEAIKLCPLILELQKQPQFNVDVCVTAQHREMLDQVLNVFEVVPDKNSFHTTETEKITN